MDAKSTKNNRRTKINPIFLEKSFIIAKFVNYNELINNNMEEAKGQSILDKMLTTFINTFSEKQPKNEAQTHFGKNLEEVLKAFHGKVNSEFEKQCLLLVFYKKRFKL